MFLSASSAARRARPQLVDLNLVPPAYRPRRFPLLSAGLSLIVVGCLVLTYALFYAKAYADLQVAALDRRVSQAATIVGASTGNPTAIVEQNRLRMMRADYRVLTERQINWGDVFQVVAAPPPGIAIRSVSQSGFGVSVSGSATDPGAVAAYLDQLNRSGLFVNAAVQVNPASNPIVDRSRGPPDNPMTPPANSPGAPAIVARSVPSSSPAAPVSRATATMMPFVALVSTPTPYWRASNSPTAVSTPTALLSPTPSPTATPTASPTPAYDYALIEKRQWSNPNRYASSTDIRGMVVDLDNNPVAGLTVQVDSLGWPAWSAQTTTTANGGFDFAVTHGKFKVTILGGRSEPTGDLYTGADGVADVYDYQLTFQKTFTGATPPFAGSPSATATSTGTTTPSATPVSYGANLASLGCVSASDNSDSASQAIDGNLGTAWSAGRAPNPGSPVTWRWRMPYPGQPIEGCGSPGLDDSRLQIEAFQLFPSQNPAGSTVHQLWLFRDPGCTTNILSSGGTYYSWQQWTTEDSALALKLSQPLRARCAIISTLASPSFVAWKEIQFYQIPAPPDGFLTSTPTPNASATATSTYTPTPTTALTPTAALTPIPPYEGRNIAPFAAIAALAEPQVPPVTCEPTLVDPNDHSDPCAAVDKNDSTYWVPNGVPYPRGLVLDLASLHYNPNSDVISEIRVGIQSAGDGSSITYRIAYQQGSCSDFGSPSGGYQDSTQLRCVFPSPLAGIGQVSVWMYQGDAPSASYGIREIEVIRPDGNTVETGASQANPSPTVVETIPAATAAPTEAATQSPAAFPSVTPTSVEAPSPLPSDTPVLAPTIPAMFTSTTVPIPTSTATIEPTAVPTPEPTMTATLPPEPTLAPTPTVIPTAPPSRTPTEPPLAFGPLAPPNGARGAEALSFGQGPGAEVLPPRATPLPLAPVNPAGTSASPTRPSVNPSRAPIRAVLAPTLGPILPSSSAVDFTIVLEVASGDGYGG